MLYVVATPIGNLSDITYRAIETLTNCDYILCEDTRHSRILLSHYNISKPLYSFHKFSESSKEHQTLTDLEAGLKICLISDAGTPGISDPGQKLIQACIDKNIPVTPIPGPCAAITALCCSGLNTDKFQFLGFLPKKAGELKKCLQEIFTYAGTTICYESPNRLIETLQYFEEIAPDRTLVVARELTKKFEEVKRGTAAQLIQSWSQIEVRGEIVLLISASINPPTEDWMSLTPIEHVELLQRDYGLTKQEAIKQSAKMRGASKRDIYNIVHKNQQVENE